MIQFIINALFVLLMLGFLVLVFKELARSQKHGEEYTHVPNLLRLVVDLRDTDRIVGARVNYHAQTVTELQGVLNALPMCHIYRACVQDKGKITHLMGAHGWLEAV